MRVDLVVERNYRIVGLTPRGTVVVEDGGGVRDSGETPEEWVGDRAALRSGGDFDYLAPTEKSILRQGLKR